MVAMHAILFHFLTLAVLTVADVAMSSTNVGKDFRTLPYFATCEHINTHNGLSWLFKSMHSNTYTMTIKPAENGALYKLYCTLHLHVHITRAVINIKI